MGGSRLNRSKSVTTCPRTGSSHYRRRFRRTYLYASCIFFAFILAACAGTLGSEAGTINVVQAAGLEDTESIELVSLPEPGSEGKPELVGSIDDQTEVHAMMQSLDRDLPLEPGVLCVEHYKLRFVQPDGSAVEMGYRCDPETVFLRGDQAFWNGQQIHPPPEFREQVQRNLIE